MRARAFAAIAACAGALHCGSDVVVGVNSSSRAIASTPPAGDAGADGGAGAGLELGTLRAVRRTPSDGHVAAGWTACASPDEPACDGWVAAVGDELVEEARIASPGADRIQALALIGDDRVLAGSRAAAGVGGAWLARRTAGAPVWEVSLSSDPARPSDARAVEVAPDGTLVVVGNETIDEVETGWIARVAPDGAVTQRVRIGGTPSASESVVDAITVLPNGRVYVGGRRRRTIDGVATTVPVVLQYAADLTLFGSSSELGIPGGGTGVVRALLGERPGEVTACAQLDDGVGVSRMRDFLSDVYVTRVITDPAGRVELGGCAATDDGGIVLAGTVDAGGPRPWATKLDRVTLETRWSRTYSDETARIEAVAAARGGGAVAVGASGGRAHHLAIDP